ncbi:hypothetical protein EBI_25950 [Enterocytozoon bieneusi H348]|nr:hypothetical protein EBI_25950 [Enterocytozoon bieneusi H348]|eukprot:XP_002650628.1 hypothetical protein EBI_25950 [Enterocytozoon bieneusi H348]
MILTLYFILHIMSQNPNRSVKIEEKEVIVFRNTLLVFQGTDGAEFIFSVPRGQFITGITSYYTWKLEAPTLISVNLHSKKHFKCDGNTSVSQHHLKTQEDTYKKKELILQSNFLIGLLRNDTEGILQNQLRYIPVSKHKLMTSYVSDNSIELSIENYCVPLDRYSRKYNPNIIINVIGVVFIFAYAFIRLRFVVRSKKTYADEVNAWTHVL